MGIALFLAPAGSHARPVAVDPALVDLLSDPGVSDAVLAAAGAGQSMLLPRSFRNAVSLGTSPRLEVFLELASEGAASRPGLQTLPLGGNLVAARLDLSQLREIIQGDGVRSVRLARPMVPLLDRSAVYLGLSRARRQDPGTGSFEGLTGRGVIVGIVDAGIDSNHPDFDDARGKTRIRYYWDETTEGNPPPDYGFGTEYTPIFIDRGLAKGWDEIGHGTHVLGIAAGNGAGSFVPGEGRRYVGMAPEATLLAVKADLTDFGVAIGAFYIFDRATRLGMPAVVNVSLGSRYGPHRGTTPLDLAISRMVGPGKLVVAAAGNDGVDSVHAELRLAKGELATLPIVFPAYDRAPDDPAYLALEGWFPAGNRYRFAIRNPTGEVMTYLALGDRRQRVANRRGVVRGWYAEDLGQTTLFLEIEDYLAFSPGAVGTWTLEILALEVGEDPELDFWMVNWARFRDEGPRFDGYLDPGETIVSPATARGALAVGAVSTRACWRDARGAEHCYRSAPEYGAVAPFSSMGPTSDGRPKPDLLAPGFGVISARSSAISELYWTPGELAERTLPGGLYLMSQGTSMAAPHVTGTAALLLQRHPGLTPDQLKARLVRRARMVEDPRRAVAEPVLLTGEAILPPVDLSLAETERTGQGTLLRWWVGKERDPVRYRVYRALGEETAYHLLAELPSADRGVAQVLDRDVESGFLHRYRITAVDPEGLEDDLDTLVVTVAGLPRPVLLAPDPNPATSAATFRVIVPAGGAAGTARVDILDVSGRHVAEAGRFAYGAEGGAADFTWDLKDYAGRRVPAGVYFARLAAGSDTRPEVHRLVVLP